MPQDRKPPRPESDLETNTASDVIDETAQTGNGPAGGVAPPDGGNPQHPIHDEDQEDRTPGDYEREIERLDQSITERIG